MGQGPKGQGGRGGTPELISANEKPKKTGPLSPAGKQDCPSLFHPSLTIITLQYARTVEVQYSVAAAADRARYRFRLDFFK